MNDNDIPDHLLSQVLDMCKEQGRKPIGFIISFDDGPTDQVLPQALDECESRGKASNTPNFDFGIDTLLPEIPTVPRFASLATAPDLKDLVSEMDSKNTPKNTRWSITVFEEWQKNHNSCSVENFIP